MNKNIPSEELLNELSDGYENISAFPLDVTDQIKCTEVFNQIKIASGFQ